MKRLAFGLAAACLSAGMAMAQTAGTGTGTGAAGTGTGTMGSTTTPGVTPGNGNAATDTHTGTGVRDAVKDTVNRLAPNQNGKAAASGDNNQAVVTTDANATQPAHGSNSFTAAQARGRIENRGFSNVTDLQKDNGGVWRGKAQKDGRSVNVWLDYKGNVGQ